MKRTVWLQETKQISKKLLDRAAINTGRCGTVTGRVCPDLPALHRPV